MLSALYLTCASLCDQKDLFCSLKESRIIVLCYAGCCVMTMMNLLIRLLDFDIGELDEPLRG